MQQSQAEVQHTCQCEHRHAQLTKVYASQLSAVYIPDIITESKLPIVVAPPHVHKTTFAHGCGAMTASLQGYDVHW